jgi:hypothetical protein
MQNIHHRYASTKGGRRRGTWSLDTCILKAPASAPSETLKGHLGVWTIDVDEEAVVANVQVDSFSQEAAGESHWADGLFLLPCFKTNGWHKVADAICLGQGQRHKLNEVVVDLDVFADALEGEELGESSSGSYGRNEGALPHELGAAQSKGPMHKEIHDWAGSQTEATLQMGGLLVKTPFTRRVLRG